MPAAPFSPAPSARTSGPCADTRLCPSTAGTRRGQSGLGQAISGLLKCRPGPHIHAPLSGVTNTQPAACTPGYTRFSAELRKRKEGRGGARPGGVARLGGVVSQARGGARPGGPGRGRGQARGRGEPGQGAWWRQAGGGARPGAGWRQARGRGGATEFLVASSPLLARTCSFSPRCHRSPAPRAGLTEMCLHATHTNPNHRHDASELDEQGGPAIHPGKSGPSNGLGR